MTHLHLALPRREKSDNKHRVREGPKSTPKVKHCRKKKSEFTEKKKENGQSKQNSHISQCGMYSSTPYFDGDDWI